MRPLLMQKLLLCCSFLAASSGPLYSGGNSDEEAISETSSFSRRTSKRHNDDDPSKKLETREEVAHTKRAKKSSESSEDFASSPKSLKSIIADATDVLVVGVAKKLMKKLEETSKEDNHYDISAQGNELNLETIFVNLVNEFPSDYASNCLHGLNTLLDRGISPAVIQTLYYKFLIHDHSDPLFNDKTKRSLAFKHIPTFFTILTFLGEERHIDQIFNASMGVLNKNRDLSLLADKINSKFRELICFNLEVIHHKSLQKIIAEVLELYGNGFSFEEINERLEYINKNRARLFPGWHTSDLKEKNEGILLKLLKSTPREKDK